MRTFWLGFSRGLSLLFVLLLLAACGGGGGGGSSSPSGPSGGWVTIDSPATESFTTICNSVILHGEAFISPTWWRCCSGTAEQLTGVTVTVNGIKASQGVHVCYFFSSPYLCDHSWSATVELALGQNRIAVTASDPSGRTGVDSITITHPETSYTLRGRVTTPNGAGLSGVSLALMGTRLSGGAYTGNDGLYAVMCAGNDSYTLTPSKSQYDFEPRSRNIVVADADVSGQDYLAGLKGPWTVSGWVGRYCSGCRLALEGSTRDGAFLSLTTMTPGDFSGIYTFSAVPNGTYQITPTNFPASPSSRTVTVFGADVVGQDFVWP